MMSKHSFIPFVGAASFLNLCGQAFLFVQYMSCNGRPDCIGAGTTISGYIIGFPLELVSWLWQRPDQPLSRWVLVVVLINALLFGLVLWAALNMLLRRWGKAD
jgi:hypothetical protein